MVDTLHHGPGGAECARRDRLRVSIARVKRLDRQPVIAARDQTVVEWRAFEHAVDQPEPLVACGAGKFGCECNVFGVWHRISIAEQDTLMQRKCHRLDATKMPSV